MADRAQHCPFLNRADDRCSASFSLDHLDRAFDYCFGSYSVCPVYAELLAERQSRRESAAVNPGWSSHWSDDVENKTADSREATHAQATLVQLTLSRKLARRTPGDSRVLASSGL
ncbi:MAG TPA: hypothetical protein VH370_14645 [Humisphaera sp.]|nr:hypothetical protein [Humisphaera sp.]